MGALCDMAVSVNDDGVLATQEGMSCKIRNWFARTEGPDDVPCDSSIRNRVKRFWDRIKPDVGKPSALRSIHEAAMSRPGEKEQRLKP